MTAGPAVVVAVSADPAVRRRAARVQTASPSSSTVPAPMPANPTVRSAPSPSVFPSVSPTACSGAVARPSAARSRSSSETANPAAAASPS